MAKITHRAVMLEKKFARERRNSDENFFLTRFLTQIIQLIVRLAYALTYTNTL